MHGKCVRCACAGWVCGCPRHLGNKFGLEQAKLALCLHLSQVITGWGAVMGSGWAQVSPFTWQQLQNTHTLSLQVLRYFDYVFTGVFTFEMVIKVRAPQAGCAGGAVRGK